MNYYVGWALLLLPFLAVGVYALWVLHGILEVLMGADKEWLRVIRGGRAGAEAGDLRCRKCGDPKEGKFLLVLAEPTPMGEASPQVFVRLCEPCAIGWTNGDRQGLEEERWEKV